MCLLLHLQALLPHDAAKEALVPFEYAYIMKHEGLPSIIRVTVPRYFSDAVSAKAHYYPVVLERVEEFTELLGVQLEA
jgi:hypothetical protein